ncbi:peptidase S74, partial [Bacillus cereus]
AGDESYKNPLQDKYVFGDYREIVDPNEELRKLYNKILASLGNKANKELLEQLEKLAEEAKKQSDQAVEESQTAKDISEKLKENIENNMVDIIEAKNPPTTGLKANKTLWRDISNGKPGILKIWTGVEWESVVPDVEGIKRDLELTNDTVKSKISEKQMEDYIGGLGSTNTLVNSAFEDREINTSTGIITDRKPSLSKWVATTSVGTSVTPTTDKRHDGYNSVKIQANGLATNVWTGVSQKTAVTSGAGKLVLSAWVFTDNKDSLDQDGDLEIKFLNGSTVVTTANVNLKDKLTDGVWTFISVTADVPSSSVTNAEVRIGIRKNGLIWVSQPQFQQGEKPSSFMENPKDYTNYDQLVDEIAKKVATSEFDSKITSVQTTINQQSDRIDLKAEKKDIYNKIESDGRYGDKAIVERHESSISLLTDEINLRVKDGDIASTINQTAQSVLIQAAKIYLDGFIEAKHLKAQELVGVTIKTAPSNENRFVQLNKQFIELYDKNISRLEMKFFNNSNNNAIIPAIVLGRSQSGGIEGASVWYHNTPLKPDGTDDSTFSSSTLGIVQYYNSTTNQFTYAGSINFARNGAISLDSNDNVNISASQQGHIFLKTDTVGAAKSIFVEPSLNFNVTAGNQVQIKSNNSHFYSNNNGAFTFENTGKTTGNQMMLSDNNVDADLRLAFIRIRASHAAGYQSYLQLVPTGENTPTAGLQLGNLSYTSLTNRSSRSIKSNIRDLEIDSLEKIMGLKVQQYNFKSDVEKLYQMRKEAVGTSQVFTTRDIPLQYGLVLEDTDETFVSDLKDGINLYTLVTLNVDATQKIYIELKEENKQLKEEIENAKKESSQLKEQVTTLTNEVSALKELVQKLIS